MGSRLSGTLAILTMDRFERLHIYPLQPAIYIRYVDDTGTVVSCTNEAQRMVTNLNDKHKTIKFELELPSEDGYLPLLDTAIKINPDGSTTFRMHTKGASKKITLHHESHHPESVKKAIISSEIRRAVQNSSGENRTNAITSAIEKLKNNGYPAEKIKQVTQEKRSARHHRKDPPLTFRFPFINNQLNTQIRRSLARHKINARLIHPRPQTLLQPAQPPIKSPECKLRNCPISYLKCTTCFVVYEITCEICKGVYIGSTTRALHERAKEHIAAARNKSRTSAIGEHYGMHHPTSEPRLQFRIIRRTEKDELRLRIEEAMAIREAAPSLNRRKEETGIDFLA